MSYVDTGLRRGMTIRELLGSKSGVLVEAHRGGDLIAPENSWEALERSHLACADLIEVDVHVTRDGIAFLQHHYTIQDRHVSTLQWADVQRAYAPADPPPRLDSVLRWARQHEVFLSLDVKDGFGGSAVDCVAGLVSAAGAVDATFLLSWNHHSLRKLKESDERFVTRAHIRAGLIDVGAAAQAARVDAVTLSYDLIVARDVDLLHERGIVVGLGDMFEPNFMLAHKLGVDIVSWGSPGEARRRLASIEAPAATACPGDSELP